MSLWSVSPARCCRNIVPNRPDTELTQTFLPVSAPQRPQRAEGHEPPVLELADHAADRDGLVHERRKGFGGRGREKAELDLPAILVTIIITVILVLGIRESASVNALMVLIKLAVVLFVIGVGAFYVKRENWHPFAPYGYSGLNILGYTFGRAEGGKPVGMLAGALRTMMERLRDLVRQVQTSTSLTYGAVQNLSVSTSEVAASTSEVAANIQNIAKGAETQATGVERACEAAGVAAHVSGPGRTTATPHAACA